ncbi:unnamed protein product [Calicophoron daubneyi]|uniref:Uncharacterized protein n=1 Tax=Calicophoron daubneyi TaxID=300641 RepID=A0AAV2TXQ1_CALDB
MDSSYDWTAYRPLAVGWLHPRAVAVVLTSLRPASSFHIPPFSALGAAHIPEHRRSEGGGGCQMMTFPPVYGNNLVSTLFSNGSKGDFFDTGSQVPVTQRNLHSSCTPPFV